MDIYSIRYCETRASIVKPVNEYIRSCPENSSTWL